MRMFIIAATMSALWLSGSIESTQAQSPQRYKTTRKSRAARPSVTRLPTAPAGKPVVKRLADLVIAKMDPDQDGRAPQVITIRNQGGTTSGPFVIGIKVFDIYGQLLYQMEIYQRRQLAPYASITRRMYLSSFGDRWSIRIDSRNQVRESNENNNAWANERER